MCPRDRHLEIAVAEIRVVPRRWGREDTAEEPALAICVHRQHLGGQLVEGAYAVGLACKPKTGLTVKMARCRGNREACRKGQFTTPKCGHWLACHLGWCRTPAPRPPLPEETVEKGEARGDRGIISALRFTGARENAGQLQRCGDAGVRMRGFGGGGRRRYRTAAGNRV